MRLRIIVLLLSLLASISAITGGYIYYFWLKQSAFADAKREAESRAQAIKERFSSFLQEQQRPVRALAGMPAVRLVLSQREDDTIAEANMILDHFNEALGANVCYIMDRQGDTLASSNRDAPDSFVGLNFSFRPYFQQAVKGIPNVYLALGTASGVRGVYYSNPVYEKMGDPPSGVAVIKASIEPLEKELHKEHEEIVLLIDPLGIVFVSTKKDWLFQSLSKLSAEEMRVIAETRQFGDGPYAWTGLEMKDNNRAIDQSGQEYLSFQMPVDSFPRWRVVYLQNIDAVYRGLSDPLLGAAGPLVFGLCLLVALSVGILYRRASREIIRRKVTEQALRESEERYRTLYHQTPGMLHSIDPEGRLVSVSDYWLETLGYESHEVIGRKLTDFLTETSRQHWNEIVLPQFLAHGWAKDVSYRMLKKNGETIDVLVSAIAERDNTGNVKKSLSVLVDVTERNRAEEELRFTREQLRRYSEDLERQVAERTREIAGILENTPAVVFMKDTLYRYVLVNHRFEQLFGLEESRIQGKTDYDLFPPDIADRLRANDRQVLEDNRAYQFEESVLHKDGQMATYLTMKFPLYAEAGDIRSICGIATDITETKKAQDQLRRLSAGILSGQEKERTAIARELHDELGQVLTALRMDAVWLRERLRPTDPTAVERTGAMCDLIDDTIDNVRGIAVRLRPRVLDDLGLVPALEWYSTDFEKRTRVRCDFKSDDLPEVHPMVATAAYRIAQEALTNVARHARARRVTISLAAVQESLMLVVADDGQGFDPGRMEDTEGLGIAGMRERASLLGGLLEIRSRRGQGTRVRLSVPLNVDDRGTP